MSNDKELLILAAKAACYQIDWSPCGLHCWINGVVRDLDQEWCPLTDEGDALRLAIDTHICIEFGFCLDETPVVRCGEEWDRENWPQHPNYPNRGAATCRAIVLAAAEVGRTLP